MLNQIVMVGRIKEIRDNYPLIVIEVAKPFKNNKGEYEKDVFNIDLLEGIHSNIINFCKINDLVGIKGRVSSNNGQDIKIIAEKVTFLSSSKKGDK